MKKESNEGNNKGSSKEIAIEHSYLLKANIADVFNYLSNPENDDSWQSSCDKVTMNNANETITVGTKYTIHFSFLSRKMQFEAHVSEYKPYSAYGYESLEGPMPYRGRYDFTQVPEGVAVKWYFTAIPGKFFGIIPKSLIKKTILKKTTEDIERLQAMFCQPSDAISQCG